MVVLVPDHNEMDGAELPRSVTSFASPDEQSLLARRTKIQNSKFCSKNIAFCFFSAFLHVVAVDDE